MSVVISKISTLHTPGGKGQESFKRALSYSISVNAVVRRGKGRKDRQTLLPAKLLELLRCYWRTRRPTGWLFPGNDSTRPISPKAVFLACRNAGRKAGLAKPVHPHSLRHAFATNLLEAGVNLRTRVLSGIDSENQHARPVNGHYR